MYKLFIFLPLLFLSCGKDIIETVEVYSYYPSGKLKAIGNYKDGKGNKQNVGVSFNELLNLEQSLQLIKPLLDSNIVVFDRDFQRIVVKPEYMNKVKEFIELSKTEYPEVELLIFKNNNDQVIELMFLDLSAEKHRLGFEKIIGAKNSEDGQNAILIQLSPDGSKQFQEMSTRNIGRKIAIVFNGKILSAPIVQSVIAGGEIQISGAFTAKEHEELLLVMKHSVLNGTYKLFRENGTLCEKRTYEKGVQVGNWTIGQRMMRMERN